MHTSTPGLREIDHYFAQQEEPAKSCLLALRDLVLGFDNNITEAWKYKMPFYCYNKKMLFYLWISKKTHMPYMGFVDGKKMQHPDLILEKRARMKILLLDPSKDIPVRKIKALLKEAIAIRNEAATIRS